MKKDKPKVSVIIPVFNEEANIKSCIESMHKQSYPNYEVILIDDGSTDKTVEIIKDYSAKLLKQSHKGPAEARNLGVKEAKGEILVFMDADMTFSEKFLEELVSPIRVGKYKGTFSKNEFISNWDNIWSRCWNYNFNLPKKRMIPEDYPDEGLDFRAILKDEFLRIGGFDDVGYTDTWTLSKKLGYKPHAVSGAIYYHANPDNLKEVYLQSKWRAKREYKFGLIGKLLALIRVSLPISVLVGVIKAIKIGELRFLYFKMIYDLGQFIGILEVIFKGKLSK